MTYDLALRSVYDFTLKAGTILGYGHKGATVLGLLLFDEATAIEDVTPIHNRVYSQLGPGVPKNAADLIYVKIRTASGEVRVLAMDWIAAQPVPVVSTVANVRVADINLSDLPTIREVLLQAGFSNLTITTVS